MMKVAEEDAQENEHAGRGLCPALCRSPAWRGFHMPGHKGRRLSGLRELRHYGNRTVRTSCYEAEGIIAESEQNAAALFGAGRTCYSTEGSSQCIRAMLRLAMLRQAGGTPLILAARNVHKAFRLRSGAAGAGSTLAVAGGRPNSLCSCRISPRSAGRTRWQRFLRRSAAVYVTSPDYLGGMADVQGLGGGLSPA